MSRYLLASEDEIAKWEDQECTTWWDVPPVPESGRIEMFGAHCEYGLTTEATKVRMVEFLVDKWGRYDSIQDLVDAFCKKFNVQVRG